MEDVENAKENSPRLASTAPSFSSENKDRSIDGAPINKAENGKIEPDHKGSSIDVSKLLTEDEKSINGHNASVEDSDSVRAMQHIFDGAEVEQKDSHLSEKDPETLETREEENVKGLPESIPSPMSETRPTDALNQSLEREDVISVHLQSNGTPDGLEKDFFIASTDKAGVLEPQNGENSSINSEAKPKDGEDGFVQVDNITTLFASTSTGKDVENGHHVVSSNELAQPHVKVSGSAIEMPEAIDPSKHLKKVNLKIGQIDTAAPFESVKAAVSKFGGIVDWKAHKVQTVERRAVIEEELEKAQEEIPIYKNLSQAAEVAKTQALKKLDSTKRLIEELKLNLERAQTEEQQGKQDSELAILRVEELEQGIADESSVAAKAQLEVAKARHVAAVSELKTVKSELELLKKDNDSLSTEKDSAVKRAEEAVLVSREVEKKVEELTIELINTKESLESAHVAHLEAEERRIGLAMAKEHDILNWERELKVAEEELERLNQENLYAKDLKSKLDTASVLLVELKTELAAYMETRFENDEEGHPKGEGGEMEKRTHAEIQEAVALAQKQLEDLKLNVDEAIAEVNCLKEAATSLKSEIETEKLEFANTMQREGMASVAVASLEAELTKTRSKIADLRMREGEARDRMVELPKQLKVAAQEADQAKSEAQTYREEFCKAKEEAEKAKSEATIMQRRIAAAIKEIEAARASEKLALTAINALKESESAQTTNGEDPPAGVAISLEEYYELTKQAYDAEEEAKLRVANAISQIEVAKESELRTSKQMEKVGFEMAAQKEALKSALEKAEKAKEGKLWVEQELRKRRAENEERRKAGESGNGGVNQPEEKMESNNFVQLPGTLLSTHQRSSLNASSVSNGETESSSEVKVPKKKKRSFFPRVFMFLARRKAQAAKSM
ncbi:hypothetical protein RHGRI_021871 [Rhododendron griersonianum]|uniref:Protein WEAK CHLOROPLAST MOVEMENT UNDER BLUE LIGHT 1-like n=1 Tax=Rhododendron griersonianum TaxID=479676 RepID=A0AAV6JLQ3_9ERIC|nr:hypothetical protein RHGRI_021871 [Rhododendron griersonianum]